MGAGIQVINEGSFIQIDENFVNQRLVWKTTIPVSGAGGRWLNLQGADIRSECPLVLARCSGWMGGFSLDNRNNNITVPTGVIYLLFDSPVEIAVFSSKGKIASGSGGVEVYNESGELVYSSNDTHPRIFNIAKLDGNLREQTVSFTGANGQLPWVCLNDITPSLPFSAGGGTDYGYPPHMHTVKVGTSSIQYRFQDNGFIGWPLAPDTSTSQFRNRIFHLPLAFIPE